MVTKRYLQSTLVRRTLLLRTWQQLVVGAALITAMLLSAALIVFQPGTRTFTTADTALSIPTAEPALLLPPGTETYYYWGQWKPLDQQP